MVSMDKSLTTRSRVAHCYVIYTVFSTNISTFDTTDSIYNNVDTTDSIYNNVDTTDSIYNNVDTTDSIYNNVDTTDSIYNNVDTTDSIYNNGAKRTTSLFGSDVVRVRTDRPHDGSHIITSPSALPLIIFSSSN